MGGLLAQIQENKWYEPEVSFACYVAKNLPVSYRQALHYIEIYETMTTAEVDWSRFQHLGGGRRCAALLCDHR